MSAARGPDRRRLDLPKLLEAKGNAQTGASLLAGSALEGSLHRGDGFAHDKGGPALVLADARLDALGQIGAQAAGMAIEHHPQALLSLL